MQYIKSIHFRPKSLPSNASYEYNIPVIKKMIGEGLEMSFPTGVTFLVGENGMGKSTLLEGMAAALGINLEGGTRNFNFSTTKSESKLYEDLVISKGIYRPKGGFFYRAESFFNVSTQIDELALEDYYGGRSLHEQSHGEAFLSLVQNRFGGGGLYLLDEPEAALSPSRLMTLLCLIHDLVKLDSQFIIATHSPILMAYPEATIYYLDEEGFQESSLEDTEHYQITRAFANNHRCMTKNLLDVDIDSGRSSF